MAMNTCVKNMEPLNLPPDPLPSGLLLQGRRGSSHSSSELSSSEWCLASEKVKENERKCEREKHEASLGSFVPICNELSLQSLVSGIYAILPKKITKIST